MKIGFESTFPVEPLRSARAWKALLALYRQPSNSRGALEILVTILPFLALWMLMCVSLSLGSWLALPLAVPTAAFLARLFMIQHDCGHGSFFRNKTVNDWVGRAIGVFTMTPYGYWRRTHAMHHAGTGNLDLRGIGDVVTLTVEEYRARSFWGRLRYRLYRHPLIMFGVGPAFVFLLQHRLPIGLMRNGWKPWVSTMGTNLCIVLAGSVLVWLLGLKVFLLVHLPVVLLAGTIGVWLFYVQHQFERTTWEWGGAWNAYDAALHGSTHYDLPGFMRWLTANIGVHHVHHLCSRIPYYRLPAVLRDHPELRELGRITLRESFFCARLALWDKSQNRLIPFGEARVSG